MDKVLRFVYTMILLSFTVMAIPLISYAYTAPDNNDYKYKYRVYNSNYSADLYTNDECALCTESGYTQDGGYRLYVVKNGYLYSVEFNYGNSARTGTNYYPSGGGAQNHIPFGYISPAINGDWACLSKNVTGYSQLETFSTYQATYEYLTNPKIDFDNPYYNPLLVVPEIEVKYTMNEESNGTTIIPLSVALKNANSNYYVEAVCVNYMPSIVKVRWQEYTALFSHKFEQHDLISHSNLVLSSNVSSDDIGNALEVAWLQDVTNYPVSEVGFSNDIGTDASSLRAYNNMVEQYEIARNVGCFYGNNTEIYVRYFTIEDDKFIVSAWRTWSSQYSENFGIELPSYYKTYSVASGYENTSQNTSVIISPTSVPDSANPSNNYGTKKGSPITINIGQNVPNYPDYPTIATYNLDNMLVSTMNQGESIGGFLTGIAGFASAALAFIPDYVWQLVAFGLGLSIVVMFLKIL